jgi:hypothetical protein
MGPRTNVADVPNGKTGDQLRALEELRNAAEKLVATRADLDELVASRNREMLRACDYYALSVEEVADASGLTPQRVNQIFAEMSK